MNPSEPAPESSSQPEPAPTSVPPALTKETVLEALKPVVDPEIRLSVVDLGLVYDVVITEGGKSIEVLMTLTTPMCPYGPMLLAQVQDLVRHLPGVQDGKVTLVWEPPWDPRTMASEEAKDQLMIW